MRCGGWAAVWLAGCVAAWAQVAPIPMQDGLPGRPFTIKQKWVIGGTGPWDYLALDPVAGQLFIAHGPAVQVVDVATGSVAGTVTGFREAHAIALDGAGDVAYVTDGPADLVRVFDRRNFSVVANIPTGPNPRSLALEPATGLLFVICSGAQGGSSEESEETARKREPKGTVIHRPRTGGLRGSSVVSTVTVIDTQKRAPVAELSIAGRLGFAESDGSGAVYMAVQDVNQIVRLDGQTVVSAVQDKPRRTYEGKAKASGQSATPTPTLDWTGGHEAAPVRRIAVGQGCEEPRGIAVDAHDARLFVSCGNQKMVVVNAERGDAVAGFTIGPGADSIVWDEARGLIYTANGGGYGSVSIIRRDVTDSYTVVQNLPTLHQARTMAVNPSSGEVYVVTTLYGADVSHTPTNGIGALKVNPIDGSFQVLVIGN